jgi:hypothetical protein
MGGIQGIKKLIVDKLHDDEAVCGWWMGGSKLECGVS